MRKRVFALLTLIFLTGLPFFASCSEGTPVVVSETMWSGYRSENVAAYKGSMKGDEVIIPLKRAGNLFFIEAEIDGQSGNFLLDLGAPYLVLNSTYFRDYEVDERYFAGTLLSESEMLKVTTVGQLNIQNLLYSDLSADVTDLGEIENKRGIKILGLLGVSLFKEYVFDLNVFAQQLILYRKLDVQTINAELMLQIPMQIQKDVIFIKGKANSIKINFSLDTGAERNLINNNLPTKIYDDMDIISTSLIVDGAGKKK